MKYQIHTLFIVLLAFGCAPAHNNPKSHRVPPGTPPSQSKPPAQQPGTELPPESGMPSEEAELSLSVAPLFGKTLKETSITFERWSLINFWASWCMPCRAEFEHFLVEFGQAFEEQGGVFVTVAVEDDTAGVDAAREYLSTLKVPATSAWHLISEPVDSRFGFDGDQIPYTVLISPSGEVQWSHTGELEQKELTSIVLDRAGFAISIKQHGTQN